eukprot:2349049-Pyramimonas_sp.AAC.1
MRRQLLKTHRLSMAQSKTADAKGYGYILSPLLRLVPISGISSCPSSDWSPSRVYPLVPPPIGPRL